MQKDCDCAQQTHVVICGHGTRSARGVEEFTSVVEVVARNLTPVPVAYAFLDHSRPSLAERLDQLYAGGTRSILVAPGMLLTAGHVKNDIPAEMRAWQAQHHDAKLGYARALGICAAMLDAAGDRIEQALTAADADVSREETLLLLIVSGSSDPDGNGDAAKVARLLCERMGFGWSEVAYGHTTTPRIKAGLEHAARGDFRRVVVMPYLLFSGVLEQAIEKKVDEAKQRHPSVDFVLAGYLGDHPGVTATFAERIHEGLANADLNDPSPATVQTGAGPLAGTLDYLKDPAEIYRRSFAIIRAEADLGGVPDDLQDVVVRVIHAAATPRITADLEWSADFAGAARAALQAGAPILVDTRMTVEGIIRRRLPAANEVVCTLYDAAAVERAKVIGNTRSAAAVDLWGERLGGAVVAIGNAPTALFRLIERLRDGAPRPAAILGFPIGLVGAAESKEALIAANLGIPYLTLRGRRGGSSLAAAAINGLGRE